MDPDNINKLIKGSITVSPEVAINLLDDTKRTEIINKLMACHGQIMTVTTVRPLKLLAKFKNIGVTGIKASTYQCRAGINYENLSAVKEKRADGTLPETPAPLSGKEWVKYPHLLRSTKNNNLLFRLYPIQNNFHAQSQYFVGGKELTKTQLKDYCLASEYADKEHGDCFDINVSSIIDIK